MAVEFLKKPERLKVAVLGCGPTGLLAAHGVRQASETLGLEVDISIYSAKRKSELFGCQYLHSSIPGLALDFERVEYKLVGGLEGYRRKVYGDGEDIEVSPELLTNMHTAWDIRQAYDQLWEMYEPAITDYYFSSGSWQLLDRRLQGNGTNLVFSSLPAPVLCRETPECKFESQMVWAAGDAPALGRWAPMPATIPPRTIVCNGDPVVEWYRASQVFGHGTIEWPDEVQPPRGASRVNKPIRTSCRCNPAVQRVGRYGRWQKGVLSDSAYFHAFSAVGAWKAWKDR